MSTKDAYKGQKRRPICLLFALILVLSCLVPSLAYADECPAGGYHDYRIDIITPVTSASDGLSLYTCKKCGYQEYVTVQSTGHEWSDWYTIQEPTCTSEGIEERVCAKHPQNTHFEQRIIPMLSATGEHSLIETARTEPTCTEEGSVTYTCTVCGYTYIDILPALNHAWGDWIVDSEPYATEEAGSLVLHDGSAHRVCANDPSHQEVQVLPASAEDLIPAAPEPEPESTDAAKPEEIIEDEPEHRFFADDFFTATPGHFDTVMLGLDFVTVIVTCISSLSLLYSSLWIHKRRKEAIARASKRLAKRNEAAFRNAESTATHKDEV